MKKTKKIFIFLVIILIVAGGAFAAKKYMWLKCPNAQFDRFCEGPNCEYAKKRLTNEEKKAFVAIKKYQKESGKEQLDNEVLKIVSKEELAEIALKLRAAAADEVRQNFLDKMAPRDKFPGDYDCMRQTYINHLSNEEVLFLNELKDKDLSVLKNPAVLQMYLVTSPKIMRCMNEEVQKKYMEEVKALTNPPQEAAPAPAPEPEPEVKKPVKKRRAKKVDPKEE